MKSKLNVLAVAALMTMFLSACAAIDAHHRALFGNQPILSTPVAKNDSDPISGSWDVTFYVNENPTPAAFTLKLKGMKVAGTAYSDLTGEGTIRDGKWEDGKLSFAVDFKGHKSLVVDGILKDGMLAGECHHPEGPTYKWEAKKK